jgi:Flp pilus assembly protein TadG
MVLPLLAGLIMLIVQFGVTYNHYVTLTDATRAGARMAVVTRDSAKTTQAVRDSAYSLTGDLQISVSPNPPGGTGSQVSVTASYPYSISLLGVTLKSGRLESTTKERVE